MTPADDKADCHGLKVLHIAPTPFFADRGCHIRIKNEIESLPIEDIDVTLCTYHHGRDVENIKTCRIWKIPGYSNLGVGFSFYKFPADFLLFFLVLWKTIRYRPDLFHCHLHEGVLIGWSVRTLLFWRRIPIIMDMQGSLSGELRSYGSFSRFPFMLKLFRMVEKVIYRLPDCFFCSSGKSRDTLVNEFHVKQGITYLLEDVVPDFCNQKALNRGDVNIPSRKKVIVYSGSLLEGKGIDTLKYLMKRLADQRNKLFFLIIGYPVADIQSFVQEHGLASDCMLTNRLDYEKLLSYLHLADIAIEPKLSDSGEGSGKTLHYMAAGLPVVCFDTANNKSLLAEAGYYAETGSNESFAQLVMQALNDQDMARLKGNSGRERIRQRYSMRLSREFLLQHYARLNRKVGNKRQ